MTRDAAATYNVHIGDSVDLNGVSRHVVGLVENPLSLSDEFALVAPGQADPPTQVTILFDAPSSAVDAFRPTGATTSEGTRSTASKTAIAVVILALETIGLLFVGLVAAAGFAVIAQRRLRALGMLGALGATDRQVRLAMVANGVVVGVAGAATGAALGLATWIALTPRFETLVGHRIDRFHLQWWAIAASMVLAVVTAVIAAWWPARSAARSSIVAALSGRPAPPKPAHRFAGVGAILLAVGLGCLAFSHRNDNSPNAFLIIAGIIATTFGMLFVGPLFIRGLALVGRRAPIALRLALRDLARYQARSAAALGAISLALAIAATVAISAAATVTPAADANLANNQLVVYLSSGNGSGPGDGGAAVPQRTGAEVRSLQPAIDALASSLHAQSLVPLTEAFAGDAQPLSPDGTVGYVTASLGKERTLMHDGRHGIEITDELPLYVATPALLRYYGISANDIATNTDIITGRKDLGGYAVIAPSGGPTPCDASQPNCRVHGVKPGPGPAGGQRPGVVQPTIQTLALPTYTSAPDTMLTRARCGISI